MNPKNLKIKWIYKNLPNCRTTICEIRDEKHNLLSKVSVTCHRYDVYTKDKGRRESMKRAILEFPVKVRAEIWEWYRILPKVPRWSVNPIQVSLENKFNYAAIPHNL